MSVFVADDVKMSGGEASSSSSSEDDAGVVMSKDMIQLMKMEAGIEKCLAKIDAIRVKRGDDRLHGEEKAQFEMLVMKVRSVMQNLSEGSMSAENVDMKALKKESKQTRKVFQANKKIWQDSVRQQKMAQKQRKALLKQEKQRKSEIKAAEKAKKKEAKQALKQVKKLEKEKKKEAKALFVQTLEQARIEALPEDLSNVEIWVDGWNISGCFGGRSRSKSKLIALLQIFCEANVGNLRKNIELFYDGNGADKLHGNVNVTHSGKNIIVDDMWVDILGKMDVQRKSSIICVTSDRELTVRLHNVGVTVMKSGRFFKGYLKPILEAQGNEGVQNGNEGKRSDDNDLVMVESGKQ